MFVLPLGQFLLFLGAYRRTAAKGHDFSLCFDLQHVQGPIDATISETFYTRVGLTINI